MSFFMVQCGPDKEEDRSKVFYYNESNAITSLDPAFARDLETMWATNQLFDGLLELDSLLRPQPCIAKQWSVSDDGLRYSFVLRNDVRFHSSPLFQNPDDRKVTAHDFVYSFNRILNPTVASPGAWIFEHLAEDGVLAINDSILELRLRQPFQPFLGLLTTQYANVVPREVVEHYGADFREHPIGTGPFQFGFWYEQIALVFHRHPNFWKCDEAGNKLPYLDAVKIDFVKDMTVEYQGLLSGRYDFMSGIHAAFKDELLTPNGDLDPAFEEQIRFQKTPFIKTDYLGFLLNSTRVEAKEQAILNPVVRQAIEMAIDKVAMVKYLRNNTVMPANDGFVPPVLLGQTQSGASTYNPEKARQLLQSNGLSKDQLHISMYATGDYADLLEYIQHALAEVGITAQVVVLQSANFKEQTSKAQLPVFRKSWLADYPDAENFLAIFRSNRFAPGGPNYMHYSSEAFDALYLRAIAETNDSLRLNMYREMNEILQRDIPVIPLYYDQVSHFVGRNVRGFRTNAINMIDLSTVQKVVVQ
ncbi:MAG: hypothetical protein RLZZ262_2075 [Bacteroidota bacterium]|jgi:ABC-type transport system substrate-binding protein